MHTHMCVCVRSLALQIAAEKKVWEQTIKWSFCTRPFEYLITHISVDTQRGMMQIQIQMPQYTYNHTTLCAFFPGHVQYLRELFSPLLFAFVFLFFCNCWNTLTFTWKIMKQNKRETKRTQKHEAF